MEHSIAQPNGPVSALEACLIGHGLSTAITAKVLASIPDSVLQGRSLLGWRRLAESCGNLDQVEARLTSTMAETAWPEGPSSGVLYGLSVLFGASPFFTDMVSAQPQRLLTAATLGPLHHARTREEMESTLRNVFSSAVAGSMEDRVQMVAEWQAAELLRIGWRDYGNLTDPETNARELSDLADSTIRWACREAWSEAIARHGRPERAPGDETERGAAEGTESSLIIVGMGKLGGRELNFSSDVDLVFLYDEEGTTTGRADGIGAISHHQFFGQMSERVNRLLSHRGPIGQFYRVDLRLRPEGKLGPVARSLESLEAYFGEQARDWERVSWLKSRAITGSDRLIHRFERIVTGFVYAPIQPERLFEEVESLKQRIDATLGAAEGGLTMDVKRGRGGIREIEFTATVLQVLYGHHHRALRVRPLLLALARLAQVGLISGDDPVALALNYGHLRRVEHRIQMEHGRQEHRLPPPGERRDVLAASLNLRDGNGLTQFMERITRTVHEWYGRFFGLDRTAITDEAADVAKILAPDAQPEVQLEALRRRGFGDIRTAKLLQGLAYGTSEVFVSAAGQRSFEQLVPGLLRLAAGRPRPDQVLVHLHSLMQRLQSGSYYYEVLAEHPGVLRMVAFLFGTSDHLSESLLAHPEFFDRIIQGEVLEPIGVNDYGTQAEGRLRGAVGAAANLAARTRLFRRGIEFEILLCALRWLVNLDSFEQTLANLSVGADAALRLGVDLAVDVVGQKQGWGSEDCERMARSAHDRLAIVALGKYGSGELNFRGDLDVIVVDMASTPEPGDESFVLVVQQLAALLGETGGNGRCYALDWRLRPWGGDGPLVVFKDEWLSYVRDVAAPWEFLSYARSRVAFGGQHAQQWHRDIFLPQVREVLRARFSPEDFLSEVEAMRTRLEQQVTTAPGLELKRSVGALLDAEFALESWLALGQPGLPANHSNSPSPAASHFALWQWLAKTGVGPQGAAETLSRAHHRLRLCENVVRTILPSGGSAVPSPEEDGLAAAVWRNLRIVGVESPDVIMETKAEMRAAYDNWVAWLRTL